MAGIARHGLAVFSSDAFARIAREVKSALAAGAPLPKGYVAC